MRIWLAIRTFFRVLVNREFAAQLRPLLLESPPAEEPAAPVAPAPAPPPRPVRSEAITLLAALQREARFVDIVTESLDAYSDAQIGAAARDVLKDCGRVVERMFALQPLATQAEGETMEVPAGYDAGQYRLTGNVAGEPPFHGRLVHAGWRATKCDLPQWSGSEASAWVVAPVEVQVGSS